MFYTIKIYYRTNEQIVSTYDTKQELRSALVEYILENSRFDSLGFTLSDLNKLSLQIVIDHAKSVGSNALCHRVGYGLVSVISGREM